MQFCQFIRTVVVVVVVVVVVETWRLGPLEKGFPSKRKHAARVGGKNRERWGWFATVVVVVVDET